MRRFFIIDKFNTWYDWRLTLTAKDVAPAEPKTNYITLDGVSGSLDCTEALTGRVEYNDRTVTASFMCSEGTLQDRQRVFRQIIAALHGRKVRLIEPDDPEHYFLGRVKIKNPVQHSAYMEFTMEAICDPWRYAVNESERRVPVAGAVDAVIRNDGTREVCPVLTVEGSVTISTGEGTATLTAGQYKITELRLRPGVNILGLSGSGAVTFTYTEADL